MNVGQLKEILKFHDDDTEIIVQADHGQVGMKVTWAGSSYVGDFDEYMMEEISGDQEEGFVKVLEIQGF